MQRFETTHEIKMTDWDRIWDGDTLVVEIKVWTNVRTDEWFVEYEGAPGILVPYASWDDIVPLYHLYGNRWEHWNWVRPWKGNFAMEGFDY